MRLFLINPANPLAGITRIRENRWNKYRIWKPLGLLALAGLTPCDWDITILDENLGIPDYDSLHQPDLVGLTAFTSQANRAYEIASMFRRRDIPVVMGGIHATMCLDETLEHVDAVVTHEAESIWETVLADVRQGRLKRVYEGGYADMEHIPAARHDLASTGYKFGSIQTTRGCPLNCSFCSVTAFSGNDLRCRPVEKVVEELKSIREKYIFVVDDNLIGTTRGHLERTKDLFRAIIRAKLRKKWFAQVSINMADDEEMLRLARKAGCIGVFIGFESPSIEGLAEVHKTFNAKNGRNFRASVKRIQRHGILIVGSFIMGLDVDDKGIGKEIANTANRYSLDFLNVMFLTPLPGTKLWDTLRSQGRIAASNFPEDWKYYTLTYPVARYKNLSWADILAQNEICFNSFYSIPRVARRLLGNLCHMRKPFCAALSNVIIISNALRVYKKAYQEFDVSRGEVQP